MKESILLNGVWEYLTCRIKEGDRLRIHICEEESSEKILPIELPFPVIYEDEDIVVVNKPADMPIHPSLNNYENTLGNAAAFYFAGQDKPFIFRCINRLDRDTTGLTILAKHMVSAGILQSQMVERKIKREYLAIVEGTMEEEEGTIDAPIGRDEKDRKKMAVNHNHGKHAVTHYKVLERFEHYTYIECQLETGRTHQIRVHMASIGHPLLGDEVYSSRKQPFITKGQVLHAYILGFIHPVSGEYIETKAPIPDYFQNILDKLRK